MPPKVVDLYAILGISQTADEKEIKKAYRKQALKWHPDKNSSPEAADKFRAVAQAFAVLGDTERRHMYDRSGGSEQGIPKDADDVDPYVVFESVFHEYTLEELVEEEILERLQEKLWLNRKISITTHILEVSEGAVRVACASKRLSFYPVCGILCGIAGFRGAGHRVFKERHDQMFMSSALMTVGVFMLLFAGRRPVMHIDIDAGRMHAGTLKLWEVDKEPEELTLVAATEKGGGLSVSRGLLCLLNWVDAENAEEQWKQFAATGAVVMIGVLPLVEFWDRATRRLGGVSALGVQGLACAASYSAISSTVRWLRRCLIDDSNSKGPPIFDPTRKSKYGPFFPRQCKPSDFLEFSKTA
eukprot:CAMPEP_0114338182 /NCGR_PEP_ID=MMETSP0101-20121206/6868_1 /TAXON_ID=38822 ORGANISM="Pteridomonas danica, Strain PT" /NCGR_SAMPLE_ID=MMETSP0101 /ASSEMBLY_ACC=CAM_ASM_000211 /LENGTH=356 /DNA_ID=CAMNT_0001470683 /DNA_START=111 /DNA_END=1181 /DNA_ORIENTATION=-